MQTTQTTLISKTILTSVLIFSLGCSGGPRIPTTLPPVTQEEAPAINEESYRSNLQTLADSGIERGAVPDGALVTGLARGQVAPYSGVLLNPTAWAYTETELSLANQRCLVLRQSDVAAANAQALHDLESYRNAYMGMSQRYQITLQGRDREILRLQQAGALTGSRVGDVLLWSGVGAAVGFGLFGLINAITH